MTENQLGIIKNMPKVILHLHLDGSLRTRTVYEWLREQGKDVSEEQVGKELVVEKNCRDLNQYLQKFTLPLEVLQTEEHIEQATYELFEDLANQGVIYGEVRFAPCKHLEKGLEIEQVVESAIRGMDKAKEKFNIEGNLILCMMRGDSKENNLKTIEIVEKYLNKGVCAIDLAGAEALFSTEDYKDMFQIAKDKNIPFTIHAGEAAGAESIRAALETGTKRIGHGVRCVEDEELVKFLKQEKIILEVCPTSNLQTRAIIGEHPINELLREGLKVTLNTDNNTVSDINIVDEYIYAMEQLDLSIEDLVQMNINAIEGAFIPLEDKEKLKKMILGTE